MRIVYDHQIFSAQRYGGISRYFVEVATRLAGRADCDVAVLALAHVNQYLGAARPGLVRGLPVAPNPRTARARRVANDALTSLWLAARAPDVVHESYYSPRVLAPRRSKIVLTVFDMINEKFPESFPAADRTARNKAAAVARADHIICISHSTRADLVSFLPDAASKVSVVHLGYALQHATPVAPEPGAAPLGEPYLLHVGLRGGYKNFQRLLRAFAASRGPALGVRLVAFGGGVLTPDERRAMRELHLPEDSVVQMAGDDDQLARLYAHATALVYPSLYEGFGIPPLEAMAFGCPVACGDTSSLPEVVGDAAELFDARDETSITAALDRLLLDAGWADTLRARGAHRLRHFSWDKCAAETYAVYRALG